jgi:hypothetical protein
MSRVLVQGIEADDQFTFNDEFISKFKRIKVPLISAKEVASEGASGVRGEASGGGGSGGGEGGHGGEAVPAAVEEERRHHVEAAIVRIMKARKTMSHNELVMETTRQLAMRFTPNPQVQYSIATACLLHFDLSLVFYYYSGCFYVFFFVFVALACRCLLTIQCLTYFMLPYVLFL